MKKVKKKKKKSRMQIMTARKEARELVSVRNRNQLCVCEINGALKQKRKRHDWKISPNRRAWRMLLGTA